MLVLPLDTIDVEFNVSHSEQLIVWAIASGRALGVDVEHIPRLETVSNDPHAFLSMEEAHVVAAMASVDRLRRLSEYWTLKEAFVKATGVGMRSDVRRLTFEIDRDSSCRCTSGILGDERWDFRLLPSPPGYTIALCARRTEQPFDVRVREFIPIDWRQKSTN